MLPKATLLPGFSTVQSLGMGFTIMLQLSERVLICTEPGSTTVMLEFAT
jgi:anti-sigma regulatory factor (Ser/Thr protein kinase)